MERVSCYKRLRNVRGRFIVDGKVKSGEHDTG